MQLLVAILVGVLAVYAVGSLWALAVWLRQASLDDLLAAMSPAGRARTLRQLQHKR